MERETRLPEHFPNKEPISVHAIIATDYKLLLLQQGPTLIKSRYTERNANLQQFEVGA